MAVENGINPAIMTNKAGFRAKAEGSLRALHGAGTTKGFYGGKTRRDVLWFVDVLMEHGFKK